jgi:predicted RNase H-like HicB family nuclease
MCGAKKLTKRFEPNTLLRGHKMAAIKDYSYTVIFEPLERGGYQAIVPALPEIITAGRTLKEARRMARDAIRCALEGMAKEKAAFPREISKEPRAEKFRVSLKTA